MKRACFLLCCLWVLGLTPLWAQTHAITPYQKGTLLALPTSDNTLLPTYIRADDLKHYGHQIVLQGHAMIRRADLILSADQIRYNQQTQQVMASGHVFIFINGNRLESQAITFNLKSNQGQMGAATFQLQSGAYGKADRIEILSRSLFNLYTAEYSGCNCHPSVWSVQAARIEIDNTDNQARAYNSKLYIGRLPVFKTPFIRFALNPRNTTGFLTPSFSFTSRAGVNFSIPFYWSILPNLDFTLTTNVFTQGGVLFDGELRYLTERAQGNFSFSYLGYDRHSKQRRWVLRFHHDQTLGQFYDLDLSAHIDWNIASDNNFYRDFQFENNGNDGPVFLDRHVYVELKNQDYLDMRLGIQQYQALQDPYSKTVLNQYEKMPYLTVDLSRYNVYGLNLKSQNKLTFFRFPRYFGPLIPWTDITEGHTAPNGVRMSSFNTVALPLVWSGAYVKPTFGLHLSRYITNWFDRYQPQWDKTYPNTPFPIRAQDGSQDRVINRMVPIFAIDSGLTLVRNASLFGQPMVQTIEPRIFYLYIPYFNQSNIPVYDTSLSSYGYASAFQFNRFYGGWDRINNANRFSWGFTSRWSDKDDGYQRLLIQFVHTYFITPNRVLLPGEKSENNQERNHFFLSVNAALTNTFNVGVSGELSNLALEPDNAFLSLRWHPKRLASLNLGYRFQLNPLFKQPISSGNYNLANVKNERSVSVSGQWPVGRHFYAVGRLDYSIESHRLVQAIAGFEYKADVGWITRVVMQRQTIGTETDNSAIYLQIAFDGLGSLGFNPFGLLKNNISGYDNINPVVPPASIFNNYP